jgi:hypothetical protein
MTIADVYLHSVISYLVALNRMHCGSDRIGQAVP